MASGCKKKVLTSNSLVSQIIVFAANKVFPVGRLALADASPLS
jgi:hypothetical protein